MRILHLPTPGDLEK